MRSRKWLGIPTRAVGWLFFVRWLAISGLAIAVLVAGGYGITILVHKFGLDNGGTYPGLKVRSRPESAQLKQLNELVVEQKAAITKLQEKIDSVTSMLELEKASREKAEKKIEVQARTIGKLNSEIETLENEKSKLKAEVEVAKADLEVAMADIKAEQSKRIRAEKDLKRTVAKIKKTEKDAKAARSALAGATARVQKLDDRILELEAILADPRDGSTAPLHAFIRNYWKDFGSRRFDRVRAAWLKPNINELRGQIKKIEWVKVKKIAAKPPSPDKKSGMTSAAYVCITSKNRGHPESDWAGSIRLRKNHSRWNIERMNINKGPCY